MVRATSTDQSDRSHAPHGTQAHANCVKDLRRSEFVLNLKTHAIFAVLWCSAYGTVMDVTLARPYPAWKRSEARNLTRDQHPLAKVVVQLRKNLVVMVDAGAAQPTGSDAEAHEDPIHESPPDSTFLFEDVSVQSVNSNEGGSVWVKVFDAGRLFESFRRGSKFEPRARVSIEGDHNFK
eukprot:1009860-Rhodomonas_salina.1